MKTERQKVLEYFALLERTLDMTQPPDLEDKKLRAIVGNFIGVVKIEMYHKLREVEKL